MGLVELDSTQVLTSAEAPTSSYFLNALSAAAFLKIAFTMSADGRCGDTSRGSIDRLRLHLSALLEVFGVAIVLRGRLSDLVGSNWCSRLGIHSIGLRVLLPIWLLAIVVVYVGAP
jgi:hypothetical protein